MPGIAGVCNLPEGKATKHTVPAGNLSNSTDIFDFGFKPDVLAVGAFDPPQAASATIMAALIMIFFILSLLNIFQLLRAYCYVASPSMHDTRTAARRFCHSLASALYRLLSLDAKDQTSSP
ncbi:hypothetical protein PM02_06610 [Sulfitobacter mediterraneus]|uniref:Uncharacterized protein n=1 Tax=Sulfitobacter mediterraneus TaxID=83219 RepID=A0A061SW67_9RHOB|nr:hypothetical protein PM02_06610 [Sulfitobacter mediterraneus]